MDLQELLDSQLLAEKETGSLSNLPDDFYEKMVQLVDQKIDLAFQEIKKRAADFALSESDIRKILEDAVELDLRKIGEIHSLRRRKLLEAILEERVLENKSSNENSIFGDVEQLLNEYDQQAIVLVAAAVKKWYEKIILEIKKS